jgi:signal transduction histidine kinase
MDFQITERCQHPRRIPSNGNAKDGSDPILLSLFNTNEKTVLIADFIQANKDTIIEHWKAVAKDKLSLTLDSSELVDDLPLFLDDLVEALRSATGERAEMSGAEKHGRRRMRSGINIGGLAEEMMLVGETVLELIDEVKQFIPTGEVRRLFHAIGRGMAASVRAYASLRDHEIVEQAMQHYSFIAHEIRGPLQTARLTATLLLREQETKRQKYFQRLDNAIAKASQLIDDSIVQVRLFGNPHVSARPTAVSQMVDTVCAEVEEEAQAKRITIVKDIEAVQVEADHRLLLSAMTNLMRNAIKFSAEGGQVSFRARTNVDRILFEVEDTCGGMPDDLPAKLFQPFVQENASRGGFGLGLLIAKRAVEAHHGTVRVINRPNEGCTFVLDLPLRYNDREGEESP